VNAQGPSPRQATLAHVARMATLTIRDVDDAQRAHLRVCVARHGRSMEGEVRAMLHDALARPASRDGLGGRIQQRFAAIGGVDVAQADRTERPPPTKFAV
jgi:plasmid stability protein